MEVMTVGLLLQAECHHSNNHGAVVRRTRQTPYTVEVDVYRCLGRQQS